MNTSNSPEPQWFLQCLDAVVEHDGYLLRIRWGNGDALVSSLERCRLVRIDQHALNLWTVSFSLAIRDEDMRRAPGEGVQVCLVVAQGWQARAELFVKAVREFAQGRAAQVQQSLPAPEVASSPTPDPVEQAVYVSGKGDLPPPPSCPPDLAKAAPPDDGMPVEVAQAVEQPVAAEEAPPEQDPAPGHAQPDAEGPETAGPRDGHPAFARVPRTDAWLNLATDYDSADLYQSILPLLNPSD